MKVLITGAAGFVGSHLVDACLAEGHSVAVIIRATSDKTYLKTLGDRITIVLADLEDHDGVVKACEGMDAIFHAAGRVTDNGDYNDFYRANVIATRNLLEGAKTCGVKRFVFISSPSIFTDFKDQLDRDESMPYPKRFANYYAETKAISEQEVLAANSPGLITCSLRPRGIWGIRDKSGFIPKLLKALRSGRLKNLAPGKRVLASLCHVRNLCEATLKAASSDRVGGQAYFIADAEPVAVWELIDEVGQLFQLAPVKGQVNRVGLKVATALFEGLWKIPYLRKHRSPPISRYSVSLLTDHGTYSTAKAQRDFGYSPKVGLKEGLDELKTWADKQGGLPFLLAGLG